MKRKRHSPEQIIAKLREMEAGLNAGQELAALCKQQEISEQTYYRWRQQYGGMKADEMKRLKELEKENNRLKRLVADQALDIQILKEVAKGNF
jgi:transposase-like protein